MLSEIAFLHRSGEFNGMWELKENFKDENVRLLHVLPLRKCFNAHYRSIPRMSQCPIFLVIHLGLVWSWMKIMMMRMMTRWKRSHNLSML